VATCNFSRSFFDCDRGRQTQAGRQIGGDSRSGWNFLIKIGCAGGALESVSIRIILFVCCNPNKPHQGAARRTDRSFYRPFWKRNRTERCHGRPRSLGCAGRMPTRDAAFTPSDDAAFWMLKTYMGILRSHCDDDCGLAIGNLIRDRRSASYECPLLAQSRHRLVHRTCRFRM